MVPSEVTSNDTLNLGQAITAYLTNGRITDREATARELNRFSRWLGPNIPLQTITPIDISRYQEQFSETSVDVNRHLEPVKTFLTNLKTQKLTILNLGAYLRLRRMPNKKGASAGAQQEQEAVRITEQGFALLTAELAHLEGEVRPEVTDQMRKAAADKDFRENAPYDAAKQRLSEVQTRINEIRNILGNSSIYTGSSTETVDLGTIVTLHSLIENEEIVFSIVGPGEVSARDGRISTQSPVGSALVNRRVGEIVEVQAPSGPHAFRIEKIERRG